MKFSKKAILFTFMAFFALGLISCKKDRVCTCTVDFFGTSLSVNTLIADETKKNAKDKCQALEDEANEDEEEDIATCELQ